MKDKFVFFGSFWEAAEQMDISDKWIFLEAVIRFALKGEEIELPTIPSIVFKAIKPVLEKNVGGAPMGNQNAVKKQPQNNLKTTLKTTSKNNQKQTKDRIGKDRIGDIKKNAPKGAQKKEKENENFLTENQGMGDSADSLHSNLFAVDMERPTQPLAEEERKTPLNSIKTAQISTQISQTGNVSAEPKISQKRAVFVKPTVTEIENYCRERGNGIDAAAFWDFYESKGWKVGSNAMKDWQAAVRTWERTEKQRKNNSYYGNKRNIITEPCDFSNEEDIIH